MAIQNQMKLGNFLKIILNLFTCYLIVNLKQIYLIFCFMADKIVTFSAEKTS